MVLTEARTEFATAFSVALADAKRTGFTQKQLAGRIAKRQTHGRGRMPGHEREIELNRATDRWEKKLSAWKRGHQLPGDQGELSLAIREIAPGSPLPYWTQLWRRARDRPHTPLQIPLSQVIETTRQTGPPNAMGGESIEDPLGTADTAERRWRNTTDGMAVPGLARLERNITPENDAYASREAALHADPLSTPPPAIRIGVMLACAPLLPETPSTPKLRARFLSFLQQSAVHELLIFLTSISAEHTWRSARGDGRRSVDAVLARSESEPPIAWARLTFAEPEGTLSTRESRYTEFILYVEPRASSGEIAPAISHRLWPNRFAEMLQIPSILAQFLSHDLHLHTRDQPKTQVGIWLENPAAQVNTEGCTKFPGTPRHQFTGYAIEDQSGQSPQDAGLRLVGHLCDHALLLDEY